MFSMLVIAACSEVLQYPLDMCAYISARVYMF